MKLKSTLMSLVLAGYNLALPASACTGITLKSKDGSTVVARTIEWAGSSLNSSYVITPRGHRMQSFTPTGVNGMAFTSRYGYVGLAVENQEYVAEGMNEAGLSAGLFYFPEYGKYEEYIPEERSETIADLQLVSWILGECKTVDEVKTAIHRVRIVNVDPRSSTVHWRFADPSGRQIVLEIIDGTPRFYENTLGVLTNSPGFEWHLTNLNNYMNLTPGKVSDHTLGNRKLSSFGNGSGFLGLPGDVTPPSRFVRAAFYQACTPQQDTSQQSVFQCFQILNNFDIPTGIQFRPDETLPNIPSATQWTVVSDLKQRVIYYRTMYNNSIRCIDLKDIDFSKVKYQAQVLDKVKQQPIEKILIK